LFEGTGTQILGVTVALACFTTAVGIVTGAADFVNEQIAPSRKAYVITIAIACIAGVLLATLGVDEIIRVAYPVLLLIYPLTIVLILLHLIPKQLTGGYVLQIVAGDYLFVFYSRCNSGLYRIGIFKEFFRNYTVRYISVGVVYSFALERSYLN
jgi:branched-subunit amino acid permease